MTLREMLAKIEVAGGHLGAAAQRTRKGELKQQREGATDGLREVYTALKAIEARKIATAAKTK